MFSRLTGAKGSDHCPVYATMKEHIELNGTEVHLLDLMNPPGVFHNGHRLRDYSSKDILSLSGRLIPEFDRRQSIRDMFKRTPTLPAEKSAEASATPLIASDGIKNVPVVFRSEQPSTASVVLNSTALLSQTSSSGLYNVQAPMAGSKRPEHNSSATRPLKRVKSASAAASVSTQGKGQQSLKGFFKQKPARENSDKSGLDPKATDETDVQAPGPLRSGDLKAVEAMQEAGADSKSLGSGGDRIDANGEGIASVAAPHISLSAGRADSGGCIELSGVHDPIASKESWSKLFTKPPAPRCEGHGEACVSMLTKKSGMNCGRSFWMCPRPLGPSGTKEKGTQWRCPTFIWCSDWSPVTGQVGT